MLGLLICLSNLLGVSAKSMHYLRPPPRYADGEASSVDSQDNNEAIPSEDLMTSGPIPPPSSGGLPGLINRGAMFMLTGTIPVDSPIRPPAYSMHQELEQLDPAGEPVEKPPPSLTPGVMYSDVDLSGSDTRCCSIRRSRERENNENVMIFRDDGRGKRHSYDETTGVHRFTGLGEHSKEESGCVMS